MAEKLLQVNFALNVSPAQYEQIASAVCESFAQVPGLKWKVWFINEQQREAGGIYLFEDQDALDAFAASELARTVSTHPALRSVTMRASDVMAHPSVVTRAPIGAALHV